MCIANIMNNINSFRPGLHFFFSSLHVNAYMCISYKCFLLNGVYQIIMHNGHQKIMFKSVKARNLL